MFGSEMLEVVIGIVFLYFVLSTICSAINEVIANALGMRAQTLETGIRNLLHDPTGSGLAKSLYDHPLIKTLGLREKSSKPSYIPSRTFALVLVDLIASVSSGTEALRAVQEGIAAVKDSDTKRTLLLLMNEAEGDLKRFRLEIERWFDDTMARVSGWYKRRALWIILSLALVVSVVSNADTLMVTSSLLRDPTMRSSIAAAAQEIAAKQPAAGSSATVSLDQIREGVQKVEFPLGWSMQPDDPRRVPDGFWSWLGKIVGLLFTTAAISLGAPFWFSVLNRVADLRAAGKRPGEERSATAKEKS